MHPEIKYRRQILATILGLCASQIAMGQQLEEVVVTAQKRSESLQEVPISIQAFTENTLQDFGVSNTDDLGVLTPGLQMNQGGVGNIPFIRGLGSQDATPGQDNSVATYVDGVLMSSVSGSEVILNSVERIEVLKGPQGTLFGRNTTGGVINIITKDPTQETALNLKGSYGNYDTATFGFYGTTGITDNLAADLAFQASNQGEGYSDSLQAVDYKQNKVKKEDVNKREDEYTARSKWKYSGDTFDATLAGYYSEYSDDMGYVRGVTPGSVDIAGNTTPGDDWDIRNDSVAWADFKNYGASFDFKKSFSAVDFRSITGWNHNRVDSFTDNDYSQLYYNNAGIIFFEETYTQEFQLLSNDTDSDLTWIVGAFALDQNAWGRYTIIGPGIGPGLNTLELNGTIDSQSYAGFGEVAYNFTDLTRVTAGLRYTQDDRKFSSHPGLVIATGVEAAPPDNYFTGGGPVIVNELPESQQSWDEPTYRLVLDHQLSDTDMVYASYNHGFRSGNYLTAVAATPQPFDPEKIDAYEVGVKSDLFDSTLRLNAAAYYYDVKDLQFQILQGTTTATVNAAGAEIQGVELDATWLPTEELTLVLGVSYVDGEYKDFTDALSITPLPFPPGGAAPTETVIDASGNQVAGTPEWDITSAITWTHLTDSGEWTANLRATYNDGYPWEPDQRLQQDSYTIVNASLGWKSPTETWGVRINGSNLLDDYYSVSTRSTVVTGDFWAPGKPRLYYVTVEYNFM